MLILKSVLVRCAFELAGVTPRLVTSLGLAALIPHAPATPAIQIARFACLKQLGGAAANMTSASSLLAARLSSWGESLRSISRLTRA
jgi:hypothetical protein